MSSERVTAEETRQTKSFLRSVVNVLEMPSTPLDIKKDKIRAEIDLLLNGPQQVQHSGIRRLFRDFQAMILDPGPIDNERLNEYFRDLLAFVVQDRKKILKLLHLHPAPRDLAIEQAKNVVVSEWHKRLFEAGLALRYIPTEHEKRRHLYGLYEWLDNPLLRPQLLQKACEQHDEDLELSPRLRLLAASPFSIDQFIRHVKRGEDLVLLFQLLSFLSEKTIMSSFRLSHVDAQQDARAHQLDHYQLVRKDVLRALRGQIADYLRTQHGILSLENLPDIGAEKYDFVDHCLNAQGALDANTPDSMLDIATVNLVVLEQLLKRDQLDTSNPRRWILKPGAYFYYYDRPSFQLTDVVLSENARA